MPTGRVLIYIAALVGAAVFRVYYVGWFGQYLFWMVLLLPPLSTLFSLPAMLRAVPALRGEAALRRGSPGSARLELSLRSAMPLGRFTAKADVINLYTGRRVTAKLELNGTGSAVIAFPLPTDSCGVLECSLVSLRLFDLMGLISIRGRRPGPIRIPILPVPAPPEASPDIDAALEAHRKLGPKPGGGYAEEHDLRDYRPGDPMRAMHWKLSSKMDKPIIREPQVNENQDVVVLFDPGDGDERSLDALFWLMEKLCAMERPHRVVWKAAGSEESFFVSSHGDAAEMLEKLLSAPAGPPPRVDMTGVLCLFIVKNGEVRQK